MTLKNSKAYIPHENNNRKEKYRTIFDILNQDLTTDS